MNVHYYNCRGMAGEERVIEFENALQKINWNIVGLSEVRREGENLVRRKNGNYFYYFGETKGQKGIGFYIRGDIWNRVCEIKGINERMGLIKLEFGKKWKIAIIQVYAPILDSEDSAKDKFYEELTNTIREEQEYYTIVMGDFNAKVEGGNSNTVRNMTIGPYALKETNENGRRVVELAYTCDLKIANTFFKKKAGRKWTWIAPNGISKNEIDHALTNNMAIIKDVSPISLSGFGFSSDHKIVKCKIKIGVRRSYSKYRKSNDKLKRIFPLYEVENANEFITKEWRRKEGGEKRDGQKMYRDLMDIIKEGSERFGKAKEKESTDDKITVKTKEMMRKREELRGIEIKTPKEKIELSEIQKLIKREIRKDIRNFEKEKTKEIIESEGSIRMLRKEWSNGNSIINKLKDKEGVIRWGGNNVLRIATDFYSKLYESEQNLGTKVSQLKQKLQELEETELQFPPIMEREVEHAIQNLKINKAPGPDKVDNNTVKKLVKSLKKPLTEVYNKVIEEEINPKEWALIEMIILHKKGSKVDLGNYRPLSLSDTFNKIFMKILKTRIYNTLDHNQDDSQAGFRKGYSTIDHLHTVSQLMEKALEYQIELHLLFIDYKKAFDSVDHHSLWTAMATQGCHSKVIKVTKELYEKAEAYIKIEKEGARFKIRRGVRQGDPLSPNMFNCVLEDIIRELNWEECGVIVNGKRINNLRFADDIILIATSASEIQKMGEDLFRSSRKRGLQPNMIKTKYMSNNPDSHLIIEGTNMEKVEDYTYLGRVISFNKGMDKEISARKEKAWKNYWSLKKIFKGDMRIQSKTKILERCVMPVLSYGAQTWALTSTQMEGLRKTQRAMERSLLNIKRSDRIKNTNIRERTKIRDVGYNIKKSKFKYAGHVMRAKNDRLAKIVTEWRPYEFKRRRGRPKIRWRDEIERRVGSLWHRNAYDREGWRKICEAYARQQAPIP